MLPESKEIKVVRAKYFYVIDLSEFQGLFHLLPLSKISNKIYFSPDYFKGKAVRGLTEERAIFVIFPNVDGG